MSHKVLYLPADVARLAGLTPSSVIANARSGRIEVAWRTPGGVHLFTEAEATRFAADHAQRRAQRAAAAAGG